MSPSAQPLTEPEVRERADALPEWIVRDNALERTWTFDDFPGAVDFVNRLTPVAEDHDHHPDIAIHYNRVTLRVWTHTADAITEKDFRLAEALSKL